LIDIDAALMERVFANLLENSAKYTPPGSEITISARVDALELKVTVEDNGPGLPRGREEALFEKFTRGEKESAVSGVGLGLAICRAIIEAHGGRIWVETANANVSNKGACFCFTLPLGTPPSMPGPEVEGAAASIAA
jgi:two-component system sensor histidine kinase KdpD